MFFTEKQSFKAVLTTFAGLSKPLFAMLLSLFMSLPNAAVEAQVSFADARRFAAQPDPDALDSIGVYARFFQEQDSLRLWLVLHSRLAYARLYIPQKKDPAKAVAWFEAVQKPWRQPQQRGEWSTWASVHVNIAYYYYKSKEDLPEARRYYEICRNIYQQQLDAGALYLAQHILTPLGNVSSALRDYEKAQQYLKEARRIGLQQGAGTVAAYATNALGMMHLNRGRYEAAAQAFEEGLTLPGISPFHKILLLLNAGLAHSKLGDLDNAMRRSREAEQLLSVHLSTFRPAEGREHLANLHDNLGNIYQAQKNWSQAAFHFKQRQALLQENCGDEGCRSVAQAALQLADLYDILDRSDSVLYYIQSALHNMSPTAALPDVPANPDTVLLRPDHVFFAAFRRKIEHLSRLYAQKPDKALLHARLEACDRLFYTDELLRRQYDFDETKLLRQDAGHPYYAAAIEAAYLLFKAEKSTPYAIQAWQYAEMAHERLLAASMQKRQQAAAAQGNARRRLDTLQHRRIDLMTRFLKRSSTPHRIWKNHYLRRMSNGPNCWIRLAGFPERAPSCSEWIRGQFAGIYCPTRPCFNILQRTAVKYMCLY